MTAHLLEDDVLAGNWWRNLVICPGFAKSWEDMPPSSPRPPCAFLPKLLSWLVERVSRLISNSSTVESIICIICKFLLYDAWYTLKLLNSQYAFVKFAPFSAAN
jgi:hypothetical protein